MLEFRGLQLITAPSEEPVNVTEMKEELRIHSTVKDFNAMIARHIEASRQYCEAYTRRAFVTQTWMYTMDGFQDSFRLPFGKVSDVTINYTDIDGNDQELDSSEYRVDTYSVPARVVPVSSFPSTDNVLSSVRVSYDVGYGDADAVPAVIKQCVIAMAVDSFEHPERLIEMSITINKNIDRALNTFKIRRVY